MSAGLLLLGLFAALPALDLPRTYEEIRAGGPGRLVAARRLVAAGPDAFDALLERLGRKRSGTTAQLRKLLDAIGGEYPDDKGVFRPPTRQQRELAARRGDPDWLVLLDREGDRLVKETPALAEPLAEAIEGVALIRGIAQAGRWERYRAPPYPEDTLEPPRQATAARERKGSKAKEVKEQKEPERPGRPTSVSVLIDLAFSEAGAVFRDEVGRQVRQLGNLAVPELIRFAFGPARGPTAGARLRYCLYQLDRMDRQNPARVLQTAPDDALRSDALRAYGETRATPAIKVVLGELDATSVRVRQIARWTWMQYVLVKPPPVPKRKRKLAGGKESQKEEEVYLDYRRLAELELGRSWKDLTGAELPEDDQRTLRERTEALFRHYDERRDRVVVEALTRGHALRQGGDLEGAIRVYDEILAEQPLYPRRAEMAPAFLSLAEKLRGHDDRRVVALLRQAATLTAGTPSAEGTRAAAEALDARLHPQAEAPRLAVPRSRRLGLYAGLVALIALCAFLWVRAGRAEAPPPRERVEPLP